MVRGQRNSSVVISDFNSLYFIPPSFFFFKAQSTIKMHFHDMEPLNLLKPQFYKFFFFLILKATAWCIFIYSLGAIPVFLFGFFIFIFSYCFGYWCCVFALCLSVLFYSYKHLVSLKKRCYINKNSCFICTL